MLSYQHEFHAGNQADLLKHTCLISILKSLTLKDKPFTVIDTHSSSGVFSLEDERILKTGEAQEGIEKLLYLYENKNIPFPQEVIDYLETEKPYLNCKKYAGSAELERLFLREKDALFLTDLHPTAIENLNNLVKQNILTKEGSTASKVKAKIIQKDSYTSLNALTPPLIKRGLIFCDPSFEDKEDFMTTANALSSAHKKWNTAIICLWYPLLTKKKNETTQMLTALENASKLGTNPCEYFNVQMKFKTEEEIEALQKDEEAKNHMYGSGLFIMNPPWQLKEKMEKTAGFLQKVFELY